MLLSVLCRDSMQVKSDAVVLYVIQPGQFLDSTEYQSTPQLDNIFKVCCRIITGHARLYGPSLRPFVSRMSWVSDSRTKKRREPEVGLSIPQTSK